MNKTMISILVMALMAVSVLGYDYGNGVLYLHITETKYEPYPVEPGEYFDLWLSIQNQGKEAQELMFQLAPEFPFSLDSNEKAERNLGKVLQGQSILVHFKVRVDPNAVEGINKLKYQFKSMSSENWDTGILEISIRTADLVLSIDSVETNPEKLIPGKVGSLKIGIKNTADSLVKNLKVKVDLSGSPIAPIGTTNEKMVKILDSNKDIILDFSIMPEPDATSGVYKLPLILSYTDEIGTSYSRNNTISLIIGDTPDLTTIIDTTTIINSNMAGEVSIKMVNKGLTDIKFLNVRLKESKDYKIISPEEVYVGNIDSDDYETAEFNIFVDTKSNEVNLPLVLEYMDANNDEYNRIVELKLPLYSAAEAKKFGLVNSGGSGGIIVFLILVVGGIFGYRKWKKGKPKK